MPRNDHRPPAERVEIASQAELRAWLAANHQRLEGVWLVTWKKHHAARHVPWSAVVDEVLAFGWIDSRPAQLDADRSMIWLAPRRAGSAWSAINRSKVAALETAGRMAPSGRAAVAAAKANGSWDRLAVTDDLSVPADLDAAFRRHPGSADAFARFPPSARRGILEWIAIARRAVTRAERVERTARLAARGLRANAWPRPPSE